MLYDLSQDALNAATKRDYELSPQEMVDKLIDGFYLMTVEPTDRICDTHGTRMATRHEMCWKVNDPWGCKLVDVVRLPKEDN